MFERVKRVNKSIFTLCIGENMFKFQAKNVIQSLSKLNKMDKKKAYTYGAIGVVVLILVVMTASFLGNAEDASFDGFDAKGYDLATSPFVTEGAEDFLIASQYPDMKENNAEVIYSKAQKEARQQEEEEEAEESSSDRDDDSSSGSSYRPRRRGYSGRGGGGGGSGASTQIGQLGNATMSRGTGGGVNNSWGSARLDTNPFRTHDRAKDPITTLKKDDARRALTQFARTSVAGAQLKEGKALNMKRALQGGELAGGVTNSEGALDLSKMPDLLVDAGAPGSTDLSGLDDNVNDAVDDNKDDEDDDDAEAEKTFWENLLDGLKDAFIEGLKSGISSWMKGKADSLTDTSTETKNLKEQAKDNWNATDFTKDGFESACPGCDYDNYTTWKKNHEGESFKSYWRDELNKGGRSSYTHTYSSNKRNGGGSSGGGGSGGGNGGGGSGGGRHAE